MTVAEDLKEAIKSNPCATKLEQEIELSKISRLSTDIVRDIVCAVLSTGITKLPPYQEASLVEAIRKGLIWLLPDNDTVRVIVPHKPIRNAEHVMRSYAFSKDTTEEVIVKIPNPAHGKQGREALAVENCHADNIAQWQARDKLAGMIAPLYRETWPARTDLACYKIAQREGRVETFLDISWNDQKRDLWALLYDLVTTGKTLAELHTCGFAHNDLNTSQIYMGDNGPLLGDLGSMIALKDRTLIWRYQIKADTKRFATALFQPFPPNIKSDGSWVGKLSQPENYPWEDVIDVDTSGTKVASVDQILHFDTRAFMLMVLDTLLIRDTNKRVWWQNNPRELLTRRQSAKPHLYQANSHYLAQFKDTTKVKLMEVLMSIWQCSERLWSLEPKDYTLSSYIHDLQNLQQDFPRANKL